MHCYTSEVNTVRDITLRKMYTACTETLRGLRLSKGIHEWQAEWERSALYASIVTHQNKVLGKSILRRRAVPSFDMLHLRCCLYPLPFFRSVYQKLSCGHVCSLESSMPLWWVVLICELRMLGWENVFLYFKVQSRLAICTGIDMHVYLCLLMLNIKRNPCIYTYIYADTQRPTRSPNSKPQGPTSSTE